jgi:prepilin-type N-terminal cleavage/methylation domain-containing protein
MVKVNHITNEKGFSLVELVIIMSIIGILAVIGIPSYSNFASKSNVKRAVNDLLQNARLASTLAIRDNQNYVIAFELSGANTYSIGFDTDGDGVPEGYDGGPVRVVNLQNEYGNNVAFGTFTNTGPDEPDNCGNCIGIGGATAAFGATADPVFQQFNPDGSVQFTGSVFVMHTAQGTGFTYMLRVSYQSGKFDLWKWDGEADNPVPAQPVNCATPPIQYCGWTEIR